LSGGQTQGCWHRAQPITDQNAYFSRKDDISYALREMWRVRLIPPTSVCTVSSMLHVQNIWLITTLHVIAIAIQATFISSIYIHIL
jgi:hypothetical protein